MRSAHFSLREQEEGDQRMFVLCVWCVCVCVRVWLFSLLWVYL